MCRRMSGGNVHICFCFERSDLRETNAHYLPRPRTPVVIMYPSFPIHIPFDAIDALKLLLS